MTIPERIGPTITHNLRASGDDLVAVQREFLKNARSLPPRKNGNILYHEIISFSDLDWDSITPTILESLTRKYLELRAPYALAYAQGHFDTDCPHVHIMISANNCKSTRRLRLSRAKFSQIKRSMEAYQRQHYPFLKHSVVLNSNGKGPNQQARVRQSRKENERDRRLRKEDGKSLSRKQQIRDLVVQQLVAGRSAKGFFLRLKILGLHLYKRGKHFAVHDLAGDPSSPAVGRRYRLSTLGLQEAFEKALSQWKTLPERLQVLDARELAHAQQLWQTESFRKQIQDVLTLHSSELSPQERERLEQLRLLRITRQRDENGPERSR